MLPCEVRAIFKPRRYGRTRDASPTTHPWMKISKGTECESLEVAGETTCTTCLGPSPYLIVVLASLCVLVNCPICRDSTDGALNLLGGGLPEATPASRGFSFSPHLHNLHGLCAIRLGFRGSLNLGPIWVPSASNISLGQSM